MNATGVSSKSSKKIIIHGAGLAGLMTGYQLVKFFEQTFNPQTEDVIFFDIYEKLDKASYLSNFNASDDVRSSLSNQKNPASFIAGGMLAPWCEQEKSEPIISELGVMSQKWWQENNFMQQNSGTIVLDVLNRRKQLQHFADRTSNYQWCSSSQLRCLEPELDDSFTLGLFFASESHISPKKILKKIFDFLSLYANDNNKNIKLRWHFNKEIDPCRTQKTNHHKPTDQNHLVFNCLGYEDKSHSNDPQVEPIRSIKGEYMLLGSDDVHYSRVIRMLHPRHPIYLIPREKIGKTSYYMVGATEIESNKTPEPTVNSISDLIQTVTKIDPCFNQAKIIEIGSGFRATYLNNRPKIIYNKAERQINVNGLYRHGFLICPALVKIMIAYLTSQSLLPNNKLLQNDAPYETPNETSDNKVSNYQELNYYAKQLVKMY